jgi:hypothetical protein
VDALVRGEENGTGAATTAEPRPDLLAAPPPRVVAALRSSGTRGTLVYTDRDCRLHALRVPALVPARPPDDAFAVGCWFELSPDGTRVAPAGAAWNGSREYAACNGRYVELRTSEREFPRLALDGCAPAWRPGSPPTLTLVRDGEVVACASPPRCEVVIARRAVEAAARQHPNVPDGPGGIEEVAIEDVAWLSDDRAALLLRIRMRRIGRQDLVAVFEGGRVRGSYYFLDDDRNRLEASPRGRYLASGTAFAVRADGPRLAVPDDFGRVREVSWSPDERWLALAAREALALVEVSDSAEPRVITLPIDALDVAWASR